MENLRWVQTFPEQSQTRVVVDSPRGLAAPRRFRAPRVAVSMDWTKRRSQLAQASCWREAARKLTEYQAELRREGAEKIPPKVPAATLWNKPGSAQSRDASVLGDAHEAMNWSGVGVCGYAGGLQSSPYALRKWHDRPDRGEVEIDRDSIFIRVLAANKCLC